MDDQLIADLKAKYPDTELHLLGNEFACVVVRVPSAAEFIRFTDDLSDATLKGIALRRLLRACVVHPNEKDYDAMVAARPGLVQTFGNELVEIAGVKAVTERKKL